MFFMLGCQRLETAFLCEAKMTHQYYISDICPRGLVDNLPCIFYHGRTALSHYRVFRKVFAPQSQSKERDARVCARVEFRQSIVAVEEIDDFLSVPVENEHSQNRHTVSFENHTYFSPDTVMLASFRRRPVQPDMKARMIACNYVSINLNELPEVLTGLL